MRRECRAKYGCVGRYKLEPDGTCNAFDLLSAIHLLPSRRSVCGFTAVSLKKRFLSISARGGGAMPKKAVQAFCFATHSAKHNAS